MEWRIRFKIQRYYDSHFQRYIAAFPEKDNYFSILPENFDEESRLYISQIIAAMNQPDKGIIMLNQPFCGDRPERCFPYFDNPYAIVVDRDPRDLYLMYKKVSFARGHLTDNVEDFIRFYECIRKNVSGNPDQRVLRIRFEDLVYKYDETVSQIERFLGIRHHINPRKYFNPEISVRNTQLINRFPEEQENIRIIENRLCQYLYAFNKSVSVDLNSKLF